MQQGNPCWQSWSLTIFLQMLMFRTFFQMCLFWQFISNADHLTFTCSPAVLHDRSNIIIHHQPRLFRRFATKHTPTFKTKTKTLLTVATCQWHMRCSSTYCPTGTARVQDRHWITTIYIQYWVKTVYWWTLSSYSTYIQKSFKSPLGCPCEYSQNHPRTTYICCMLSACKTVSCVCQWWVYVWGSASVSAGAWACAQEWVQGSVGVCTECEGVCGSASLRPCTYALVNTCAFAERSHCVCVGIAC